MWKFKLNVLDNFCRIFLRNDLRLFHDIYKRHRFIHHGPSKFHHGLVSCKNLLMFCMYDPFPSTWTHKHSQIRRIEETRTNTDYKNKLLISGERKHSYISVWIVQFCNGQQSSWTSCNAANCTIHNGNSFKCQTQLNTKSLKQFHSIFLNESQFK